MDKFFSQQNCDRCGKPLTGGRTMSMYNTDCICMMWEAFDGRPHDVNVQHRLHLHGVQAQGNGKSGLYKGKKKALGSSVFLAPSGALGTTEIPFKRTTDARLPIEAIRTVSIPQMIGNKIAAADIKVRINNLLITRLQHNIDRYCKK